MQKTIERFEQNKALLRRLADFVARGRELGVEIDEKYSQKINDALKSDETLQVAFVGGFSEGKTSIIAAWLEKVAQGMDINAQESSDDVSVYEVDEKVSIVDTPGLWGFKEDANHTKFKDKTKRYVSQAHIIVYVMNSSNPIKDSHTEMLRWLFRDLGLLGRTVFVCSKFDGIAILKDEEDYEEKAAVARENVIKGLKNAINLSSEEEKSLKITAIAANPYGKGITHWLENKDEFRRLSRIGDLQGATFEIIREVGEKELGRLAEQSIFGDVFKKQMTRLDGELKALAAEIKNRKDATESCSRDMSKLESKIAQARGNLTEFLATYIGDLIAQTNGLGMESAQGFLDREIGKDFSIVNAKIAARLEREFGGLQREMESVVASFKASWTSYEGGESLIKSNLLQALKGAQGYVNPQNIIAARDAIVSVGNAFGVSLKEFLKFAPRGAIKLASGVGAALGAIALALEGLDSYQKMQKEKEFAEEKSKLVEALEKVRSEVSEGIKNANFEQLEILKGELAKLQNALAAEEAMEKQLIAWKNDGEKLEAEFRRG